jgi:signal transduction histidine kinase
MDLYKGRIDVISKPNGETSFTLVLPQAKRREEDSGEKS